MAFRFQRRVRIAPGLRLNLSKSGVGLSVGQRGASLSIGKRGVQSHVGLPGTGLAYRQSHNRQSSSRTVEQASGIDHQVAMRVLDDGRVEFHMSDGTPAPASVVKKFREQHDHSIQQTLQNVVDQINITLDECLSIHLHTPPPHWRPLSAPNGPPPQPIAPTPKPISLLQRLLGRRARIEAENRAAAAEHHQAMAEWRQEVANIAALRDEVAELNAGVSRGSLEACQRMLDIRLGQIAWAKETNVSYDLGDNVTTLAIDVDLPTLQELPSTTAAMPSRGLNLKMSKRSEAQLRKDIIYIAHASIFRVAGEAFAALPMLETVLVSGYAQRPNAATGHVGDVYIISTQINRSDWEAIDFANLAAVDVAEALGRFQTVRDLKRGNHLGEIEPLPAERLL